MNAGTKYTVREILEESGIENALDRLGKQSASIAGLIGITDPDKVIKMPKGGKITVAMGQDSAEIELGKHEKGQRASAAVIEVKEAIGQKMVEKFREQEEKDKIEKTPDEIQPGKKTVSKVAKKG